MQPTPPLPQPREPEEGPLPGWQTIADREEFLRAVLEQFTLAGNVYIEVPAKLTLWQRIQRWLKPEHEDVGLAIFTGTWDPRS